MSVRLVLMAAVAVPLIACGNDKPHRAAPSEGSAAAPSAAKPAAAAGSAAKTAPPAPAVAPFRDETFGFAVDAARAPTQGEQQVPTAVGTLTAHTYIFSAASAPGAMLVAVTPAFDEHGDLDVKRALDDGQNGSLQTMGGTLVDSADLELDGATGRMFRFTAKPQGQHATGYAKMFLRDGTLYQILVVHMDSAKAFKAEGEQFVDSFRFIPRKG